jgi:DNA segregation ATPase FtsK/SpoIIIE, S-DNA-T family
MGVGKSAAVAGVTALVLWLIDSMISREQMWPWLAGLYEVLATLWVLATATMPALAALGAVGWLVAAVYEGRDRTPGAGFLVRPEAVLRSPCAGRRSRCGAVIRWCRRVR